jgi:uncharacterized protein
MKTEVFSVKFDNNVPAKLAEILGGISSAAVAFSGGVDSTYLLYAANTYGVNVKAYFIKSQFQPEFELRDAKELAAFIGVPLDIIELDVLANSQITANPENRCYFCKKAVFGTIIEHARKDGFSVIFDGTNASDDADDRPGMKALSELAVRSPLREAGLTKSEIRALSKEAGLSAYNKPAYACLATRIPAGREILAETLSKVENSESALFSMGFSDLRCRVLGEAVKIQLPKEQISKAAEKYAEIAAALSTYFRDILLDLKPR